MLTPDDAPRQHAGPAPLSGHVTAMRISHAPGANRPTNAGHGTDRRFVECGSVDAYYVPFVRADHDAEVSDPMSLPTLDFTQAADRATFDALVERLRHSTAGSGEVAEVVEAVVEDVRRNGDDAVVKYMRQWTNPKFTAEMICVSEDELAAARQSLSPELRDTLKRAIEHVRAYALHTMPQAPAPLELDGARLGLRFTPVPRVGLAVPGGRAAYPSSVYMLAVPAQVAGVGQLSLVSPPPTVRPGEPVGDISPLVLGACDMLELKQIYRVGGAQAMAALAFGTETIKPVDFIAGPGNAYTQQAKRQLLGIVGIDGFFGPSEVVILADATADPQRIAADLLAQAEHDPGCCFLISTRRNVIDAILAEVEQQLPQRQRRDAIVQALTDWSAAICVPDDETAASLVDALAAEHVTLAVEDPEATLKTLQHGGAWFLGDATPVASGDYIAGPSHCLPTGTSARYNSGCSVYTFLKRSSVEQYPNGMPDEVIDDIARLAEAEGLDAHAHRARARRRQD